MIGSPVQGNVSIVPFLPAPAIAPLVGVGAPAPSVRKAAPPAPSRSIPQGVHADGTPAELPPLPPDETEPDSSSSESSEPMPSPQTKKVPQPKPAAKPATDSGMNKVEFTLPKAAAMLVPSLFMPSPSVGFQFLMPIKPLSFKLPFRPEAGSRDHRQSRSGSEQAVGSRQSHDSRPAKAMRHSRHRLRWRCP